MKTAQTINHLTCPAYKYCQALESYGVPLLQRDKCCYTGLDSRGELSIDARMDADRLTEDKELVAALFDAVFEVLVEHEQQKQTNGAVLDLKAAFDAVFAAHLSLWQAMIGAAKSGRTFLDVELEYYQQNIDFAQTRLDRRLAEADQEFALHALTAHDRALKERYDLQFDTDMIADINQLVGNVINMQPTLVVGDKGIAKTQIAKFVAGLYGSDPIVISVKGDMMSDELIGKLKHDRLNNTFVFQEGMLLTAMRKGLPILLDEINFGDQAIIARLQDILLRKPGDTVYIQESGDEPITVQPGFVVFATANEASERYRHREILDPAIRDRFDIIMRAYPDTNPSANAVASDDPLTATPTALLRLALSSAVDDWGVPSKHIDLATLESFVRLAHVTQYLYSVPAKDVVLDLANDQLTSAVLEESQPLMTDCITPRTVSKMVACCAAGNLPGVALDTQLLQRTARSLDQAGSTHNYELTQQVGFLLDIGSGATLPTVGEGGAPVTEFVDLDDLEASGISASGLSEKAQTALLTNQLSIHTPAS